MTTEYGILLSSASQDVYADLVGPQYVTKQAADEFLTAILHSQPGIKGTVVTRTDTGWQQGSLSVREVLAKLNGGVSA